MRDMTKNILFLLVASGLIFANAGCTSKTADDGAQVLENADVEKIEAESDIDQATDPSLEAALGETTSIATTEPVVDATSNPADEVTKILGDTESNAGTTSTETTTMTTAEESKPTTAETSTTTTTTEAPVEAAPVVAETSTPATPAESSEITETPITDTAAVEAAAAEAKVEPTQVDKPKVAATPSIKKVNALMPYQGKDGAWINTVYIARPNEKLADISNKIFGSDKSADLKKIAENSYLKSRSVKAGDKVYYTSPNRPDDSTKTMLYYEDMGMVPETYVAKKGESLRKVSKKLLGYDNAWKEVWVSNSTIESKTTLKDGDTLRYWIAAKETAASNSAAGSATLVDSSQAPQPTTQISPPAAAQTLPPPPADANANLPPPPDMNAAPPPADAAAAGTTEASLPPPADMSPPPPPPPEEVVAAPKKKINLDEEAAAEEEMEGLSSDTLMSMGALGVLVALLALVIIRKKKQKSQAAQAAQMNNEINV
jgi:hypothetical protein